jgi:4-carboxymuconolactone decarboxylase
MDREDLNQLGGRLPLLDPDQLRDDQRQLYELLDRAFIPWTNDNGFVGKTDSHRLIGPFNPLLHSPAISQGYVELTNAESAHTSLDKRVREVVILTTGAQWDSPYELYAHTNVARKVGIPENAIAALVDGRSSSELNSDEQIAHRFARQLVTEHQVSPELYVKAEAAFGRTGLVDLVYLIGMYLFTCALLNAFDLSAPPQLPAK